MTIIRPPGRAATRLEQTLIADIIKKQAIPPPGHMEYHEDIVVHHITEDTPHKLQVEIERRIKFWRFNERHQVIKFERVYI